MRAWLEWGASFVFSPIKPEAAVVDIDWGRAPILDQQSLADYVNQVMLPEHDHNTVINADFDAYGDFVWLGHEFDADGERSLDQKLQSWLAASHFYQLISGKAEKCIQDIIDSAAGNKREVLDVIYQRIARNRERFEQAASWRLRSTKSYQQIQQRYEKLLWQIYDAVHAEATGQQAESTEVVSGSWTWTGVAQSTLQAGAALALRLVKKAYHHPGAAFTSAVYVSARVAQMVQGVGAEMVPVGQEMFFPEVNMTGFGIGNGFCYEWTDGPSWMGWRLNCNVTLREITGEVGTVGDLTTSYIPALKIGRCGERGSLDGEPGTYVCNSEVFISNPDLLYDRLPPGFGVTTYEGRLHYQWPLEQQYRFGYSGMGGIDMSFCKDSGPCTPEDPVIYAVNFYVENTPPIIVSAADAISLKVGFNSFDLLQDNVLNVWDLEEGRDLMYSYQINNAAPPTGWSINRGTGRLNLPQDVNSDFRTGVHNITISASDGYTTRSATMDLLQTHNAPEWQFGIENPGVVYPGEQVPFNIPNAAYDQKDGDAVRWYFADGYTPFAGLTLDAIRGLLNIAPAYLGAPKGDNLVSVKPCDDYGYCAEPGNFTVPIGNWSPVINDGVFLEDGRVDSPADLSFFTATSVTDVDNYHDDLQFQGACTYPDGQAVAGVFNSTTWKYSYTPSQLDEGVTFTCTRSVNDGDGGVVTQSFPWTIRNNEPYVIAGAVNAISGLFEQQAFCQRIANPFFDPDDPDFSHIRFQFADVPDWAHVDVLRSLDGSISIEICGTPPDGASQMSYHLVIKMLDHLLAFAEHAVHLPVNNHVPLAASPVVTMATAYAGEQVLVDLTGRCHDNDSNAIMHYQATARHPAVVEQTGNLIRFPINKDQTNVNWVADIACCDQYNACATFEVAVPTQNNPADVSVAPVHVPAVGHAFILNVSTWYRDTDGNSVRRYFENLPPWGLTFAGDVLSSVGVLPSSSYVSSARFCAYDLPYDQGRCRDVLFTKDNTLPVAVTTPILAHRIGIRNTWALPEIIDVDNDPQRRYLLRSVSQGWSIQGNLVTLHIAARELNRWFNVTVVAQDSQGGETAYPLQTYVAAHGIAFASEQLPSTTVDTGGTEQPVLSLSPSNVANVDGTPVEYRVRAESTIWSWLTWLQSCTINRLAGGAVVTAECYSYIPSRMRLHIDAVQTDLDLPDSAYAYKDIEFAVNWTGSTLLAIYPFVFFAMAGVVFKRTKSRIENARYTHNVLAILLAIQYLDSALDKKQTAVNMAIQGRRNARRLTPVQIFNKVSAAAERCRELVDAIAVETNDRLRTHAISDLKQHYANVDKYLHQVSVPKMATHEWEQAITACQDLILAHSSAVKLKLSKAKQARERPVLELFLKQYLALTERMIRLQSRNGGEQNKRLYTEFDLDDLIRNVVGTLNGLIDEYEEDGIADYLIAILRQLLQVMLLTHTLLPAKQSRLQPVGRFNLCRVSACCGCSSCQGGIKNVSLNEMPHDVRVALLNLLGNLKTKTKKADAHLAHHAAYIAKLQVRLIRDDDKSGVIKFVMRLFDTVERRALLTQLRQSVQTKKAGEIISIHFLTAAAMVNEAFVSGDKLYSLKRCANYGSSDAQLEVAYALTRVMAESRHIESIKRAAHVLKSVVVKRFMRGTGFGRDDGRSLERYHDVLHMVMKVVLPKLSDADVSIKKSCTELLLTVLDNNISPTLGRSSCCARMLCCCGAKQLSGQEYLHQQRVQAVDVIAITFLSILKKSNSYHKRSGNKAHAVICALEILLTSGRVQARYLDALLLRVFKAIPLYHPGVKKVIYLRMIRMLSTSYMTKNLRQGLKADECFERITSSIDGLADSEKPASDFLDRIPLQQPMHIVVDEAKGEAACMNPMYHRSDMRASAGGVAGAGAAARLALVTQPKRGKLQRAESSWSVQSIPSSDRPTDAMRISIGERR